MSAIGALVFGVDERIVRDKASLQPGGFRGGPVLIPIIEIAVASHDQIVDDEHVG